MKAYLITMIVAHTLTMIGAMQSVEGSKYPTAFIARAFLFLAFAIWTAALLMESTP